MSNVEEYKPSASRGKDVRVACKDDRFRRMLTLEFERIGVELLEYSEGAFPSVLLVDLDDYPELVSEVPTASALVGWTRGEPSDVCNAGFSAVLHRPFLTEELLLTVGEFIETETPSKPKIEFYHRADAAIRRTEIYPTEREEIVSAGAENVKLSPKEWLIFKRLYEAEGETVTRDELARLIGADTGANTLEVHICHLRDKIEKPLGIKVFYTVRGVGYRMSHT